MGLHPGLEVIQSLMSDCPAFCSRNLVLYRMRRALPTGVDVEFPADNPLNMPEGVYTRAWMLQPARSERKEVLRYVAAEYRSHPCFSDLRNEINAMFSSPCDNCLKVDKISYCARCQPSPTVGASARWQTTRATGRSAAESPVAVVRLSREDGGQEGIGELRKG